MFLFACDRSDQQIKVYRVAKAPLEATPSARRGDANERVLSVVPALERPQSRR